MVDRGSLNHDFHDMRSSIVCGFAGASMLLLVATDSLGQQDTRALPSAEAAYSYALGVTLGGKKSETIDKRVGPVRAIVTCSDADSSKLVQDAVAAINDAFGYGKIALSESEETELKDDAISIFIGSKSQGRQLVERFGVSSPRTFGSGVYYYWWDDRQRNHIRRCLIAIDVTSPSERKAQDLRYLLMACMGFTTPWLSSQSHPEGRGQESHQTSLFSDLGIAVVRFFDKHVDPGMRAHEMRRAFKVEWPDFSSAYWNPSAQNVDQR